MFPFSKGSDVIFYLYKFTIGSLSLPNDLLSCVHILCVCVYIYIHIYICIYIYVYMCMCVCVYSVVFCCVDL
jgi:hypothetical protein